MKKNGGIFKRASGYVSERNTSSKGLFDSLFELELAERNMIKRIAPSGSLQKEQAELDAISMQFDLHPPGSPEYEEAEQRLYARVERIRNYQPEPAGLGEKVTEILLRLKYDALHMISMILTLLLVVVFNVAALVGLIYFLPTIVEWLF